MRWCRSTHRWTRSRPLRFGRPWMTMASGRTLRVNTNPAGREAACLETRADGACVCSFGWQTPHARKISSRTVRGQRRGDDRGRLAGSSSGGMGRSRRTSGFAREPRRVELSVGGGGSRFVLRNTGKARHGRAMPMARGYAWTAGNRSHMGSAWRQTPGAAVTRRRSDQAPCRTQASTLSLRCRTMFRA